MTSSAMLESDGRSLAAQLSALMERYANGDELAFSGIYDAMASRLYGFLLRETRSRTLAEDLVQETFLRVHHARSRYLPGTDITPWFFAIARRLMIDARRQARRHPSLSTETEEGYPLPPELVSQPRAHEQCYSQELESILGDRT